MHRSDLALAKSAVLIAVGAFLAVLGTSGVAAQEVDAANPLARKPSYTSKALGMLPGDNESSGYGVNDAGSVVGYSRGASGDRAFYWDRPTDVLSQLTTNLPNSVANAIAGGAGPTAYAVGHEYSPVSPSLSYALIWIAPPTSSPTRLDGEGSIAFGVNDNGVVVGRLQDMPVIWSPNATNGYTRTDIARLPDHVSAAGFDINIEGIVVGFGILNGTVPRPRAFLRLLNGNVLELPRGQGDDNSVAEAVSRVFTNSGNRFVYVAGWMSGAASGTRGVRWTVNVDTGVVVDLAMLDLHVATGVNSAGDVAGDLRPGGPREFAALWQGGSYTTLAPPKGLHFNGSRSWGLARSASSPTYVVGQSSVRGAVQAVVWQVD